MYRKTFILAVSVLLIIPAFMAAQQPDSFTSFGAYWHHRASQFRTLPNPEHEICFLGDSITDGCEWSELTGCLRVTNRGIGGDTAWGVLTRLDEVTEGKPEKVFLMIGTNDLARGKTPTEVHDKIAEIISTIQRDSPETTIYLQSVFPTNEDLGTKYSNDNINPLNDMLKKLASVKGVTWVDVASVLKDENGKLKRELTMDGLHLNGQAYYLWYSVIRGYL
ncbi:MAG: hypothetical protein JXB48_24980 [Candidatus Latescibacteria bacterium]|nr:hypothetical protein [Candidatus Latescibacterota bacterium]